MQFSSRSRKVIIVVDEFCGDHGRKKKGEDIGANIVGTERPWGRL